jgi:putative spermidine/putrescine transport system substrate-binding protein
MIRFSTTDSMPARRRCGSRRGEWFPGETALVPGRLTGRTGSLTRRAFTLGAGAATLAVLGSCSLTEDDAPPAPTETPEPTPTPEVSPTPTQEPIASPVPGFGDPERWAGRVITVASWGGTYQDAQRAAFFEPFAQATGASVQEKVADLSDLRAQVENGNVLWDVLTVPMEDHFRLAAEDYLQPLRYDVIDTTPISPDVVFETGIGASYFSTVLIYPVGSQAAPASWADFWNVVPPDSEEFDPLWHQRSLHRSPVGTLEFALLADDVPVESLYPLDVDRAFASLDRIRENVLVWWQESKEPIELVAAAQVGMASAFNARIEQLALTDQIRTLWYQGMLSADAWVAPAGGPNADVAMDFIAFATRAIPTANFSRLVPFGPVNVEAFEYLRLDRAETLPSAPANKAVQFVEDWAYWARNFDELSARFEEWLLQPEGEATPTGES